MIIALIGTFIAGIGIGIMLLSTFAASAYDKGEAQGYEQGKQDGFALGRELID